jgi:GntR family transcriptional repressor for pyruvate dehydrogenase complex
MKKKLASTQVLTQLKAHIEKGIWKPGEKLPSLSSLSKIHHVSVSTLREALKVLENQGYLLIEQGRGMFVRSKHHWRDENTLALTALPVGDLFSLLELRSLLEPQMAYLAAEKGSHLTE